jgi:hypothetical protein
VAEAILRFRALDSISRQSLEHRARTYILQHRTWDVLAARIAELLDTGRVS